MNENWIRSNILSSKLIIYLEKGLFKPFVLRSPLPLFYNLTMNKNCLPKLLCLLHPAFFLGLCILFQDHRNHWNHCEGCFLDNISASTLEEKKRKRKIDLGIECYYLDSLALGLEFLCFLKCNQARSFSFQGFKVSWNSGLALRWELPITWMGLELFISTVKAVLPSAHWHIT